MAGDRSPQVSAGDQIPPGAPYGGTKNASYSFCVWFQANSGCLIVLPVAINFEASKLV